MWSYTLYKQRTSFTCYENPCVICPWTSFSKRNPTLERGILSFSHRAYYQSRIFTCAFNIEASTVIIPVIYCRVPANNNSDVIWLAYAITNCKGYQKDALSIQQGVIPSQLIIDTTTQHLNNCSLNVIYSPNRLVPSWRRSCPQKHGFCNCQLSGTQWFPRVFLRRILSTKMFFTSYDTRHKGVRRIFTFLRSFSKNDNFSGALFFFVYFFAVVAWLNEAKLPISTFYGVHEY